VQGLIKGLTVFVGWDDREARANRAAVASMQAQTSIPLDIRHLRVEPLIASGLYSRRLERRGEHLWDPISEAPMTTSHAIARFFLPLLMGKAPPRRPFGQWALFVDGDVLVRTDLAVLRGLADEHFGLQCVKHRHEGSEERKKGGMVQTAYSRKNWSSVMLWNLAHPAHRELGLTLLNNAPGRDLHRFCWLKDAEIGSLPPSWNHLVGVNDPNPAADLVHFTLGMPYVPGYEEAEHAEEWRRAEPTPEAVA